jgi:hypothetical protein
MYCQIRTGGDHRWTNTKQFGSTVSESCKYCKATRARAVVDPPAPNPEPKPEPDPDDGGDSLPPVPAAAYAPRFDTSGAVAAKWGGGSHWNEMTSKGMPKIVLSSKFNGKVAWVSVWGSGYQSTPSRFGGAEEPDSGGPRQRYYVPGQLPESVTVRLHIPGGQDLFYLVPRTTQRQG